MKRTANRGTRATRDTASTASNARRVALFVHHRDMSTDEILARMRCMGELIRVHDDRRTRLLYTITEAQSDLDDVDRTLDQLRHDAAALDVLIKTRQTL